MERMSLLFSNITIWCSFFIVPLSVHQSWIWYAWPIPFFSVSAVPQTLSILALRLTFTSEAVFYLDGPFGGTPNQPPQQAQPVPSKVASRTHPHFNTEQVFVVNVQISPNFSSSDFPVSLSEVAYFMWSAFRRVILFVYIKRRCLGKSTYVSTSPCALPTSTKAARVKIN